MTALFLDMESIDSRNETAFVGEPGVAIRSEQNVKERHAHHYRLTEPNGPLTEGVCKHCGATRVYNTSGEPEEGPGKWQTKGLALQYADYAHPPAKEYTPSDRALTHAERGRLGGLIGADRAGHEGMAARGAKGGAAVVEKYGPAHMARLAASKVVSR